MDIKSPHGGPDRGQGRHEEPGYSKPVKHRFLNKAEEDAIKQFTPRQRVELLLALREWALFAIEVGNKRDG